MDAVELESHLRKGDNMLSPGSCLPISCHDIAQDWPVNSSTPVACVHDDILHEIFLLVATDSPFPYGTAIKERTSWLSISYVCRYWRCLALASSQLWSSFCLTEKSNIAMIQEFLRRSRHAMLHITFSGPTRGLHPTDHFVRISNILLAHTHRIVDFELLNLYPRETDAILSAFTCPAPQLRRLVIRSIAIAYHHTLFGGTMPLLREISLAGVATSWLPYKNLTVLTIYHQEAPAMSDLLWTLINCPAVEQLLIGFHTLSDNIFHDPEPECTIALNHLRHLSVTSRPDHVLSILSSLAFPPTATVAITFSGQPHSAISVERLSRRCSSLNTIAATVQHAVLEERFGARLRSDDSKLTLKWSWSRSASDPVYTAFETTLFPALHHLTVDYGCSTEQWLHILGHVPTLDTISVHAPARDMSTLYDALGRTSHPASGRFIRGIACPSLKHFSVSQIDPFWSGEYVFERIVLCFRNRAAAGYRVAAFEMPLRAELIFPPMLLAQLMEAVDTVDTHNPFFS